jgi:hypothetical protein
MCYLTKIGKGYLSWYGRRVTKQKVKSRKSRNIYQHDEKWLGNYG